MPFLYIPQVTSTYAAAYSCPDASASSTKLVNGSNYLMKKMPAKGVITGATVTATDVTYTIVSPTTSADVFSGVSPSTTSTFITVTGFAEQKLNVINAPYKAKAGSTPLTSVTVTAATGLTPGTYQATTITGWTGNPKIQASVTTGNSSASCLEWRQYHTLDRNISKADLYDINGKRLENPTVSAGVDSAGGKYVLLQWNVPPNAATVSAGAYTVGLIG